MSNLSGRAQDIYPNYKTVDVVSTRASVMLGL